MRSRRGVAFLVAVGLVLALLLGGGPPAQATAGAIDCVTAVVVTISPPQSIGQPPGWPSPSITFSGHAVCSGTVKGVLPISGTSPSNPNHCTDDPPNPTTDEAAMDALCSGIIPPTHVGPTPNSMGPMDDGSTCNWTTNGHAVVTTSSLDLTGFRCQKPNGTYTFGTAATGGSGSSYGTAAIVFDPTITEPLGDCPAGNPLPGPKFIPYFKYVVSIADFLITASS